VIEQAEHARKKDMLGLREDLKNNPNTSVKVELRGRAAPTPRDGDAASHRWAIEQCLRMAEALNLRGDPESLWWYAQADVYRQCLVKLERQQQPGQPVQPRRPKSKRKRKRKSRITPTEKQMEAYRLHCGGLPYVEIGEQLGISAAAVGKRVRAAKKLIDKYSRSVRAQRLPRDRRGQETVTGR
jgi:DNA-binding CsgD family transcriptional regulator